MSIAFGTPFDFLRDLAEMSRGIEAHEREAWATNAVERLLACESETRFERECRRHREATAWLGPTTITQNGYGVRFTNIFPAPRPERPRYVRHYIEGA